jgi:hypothetical protein
VQGCAVGWSLQVVVLGYRGDRHVGGKVALKFDLSLSNLRRVCHPARPSCRHCGAAFGRGFSSFNCRLSRARRAD